MNWQRFIAVASLFAFAPGAFAQDKKDDKLPDAISYYKDVRPIFQQHCQGCHQPAQAKGGYVMTSYPDLLKKSDNDVPGIVPGKPAESELLKQITSQNGEKPAMPRMKDPLTQRDVTIIR
jgi:mono/diheme cytochrome c family protein